jgi:hypothetical protein
MSTRPTASLSAALLVTRGNAQLSGGLAQPMTGRAGFAIRSIETRDPRDHPPAEPTPATWPPSFVPPPPPPDTAFTRLTLRVDDAQRLRLRLASAHLGKSRQVILIEALDHYFKRVLPAYLHDPCPCIQGGGIEGGGIQGDGIQDGSAIGGDCCQRSEG